MRKGRPSILHNSPTKIQLFDLVVVAGGSRGRPLKRNTCYSEFWTPKCLQSDLRMVPKKGQNCIQNRCQNCSKKVQENIPRIAPKWDPKWCPGGAKIDPRRSRGHPPGTGTSPGRPLDPPGPHFGSPGAPRDSILMPFWQALGLRPADLLLNSRSSWQQHPAEFLMNFGRQ